MAKSIRCIFLFFALISSWAFVGDSQGLAGGESLPCIQKLMPCQPYLKGKSSSSSPPATCCAPMKEIVARDSACLCAVFNNQEILKSLNVTQDDGLNLVKSCGANADTSLCEKGNQNSTAPAAPSTNSTTAAVPPKSGAPGISPVGGYLSLAAILSFIFSL